MIESEDKYYLKYSKTETYVSMFGLTENINEATKFTKDQLKNRFKVPKTHNNVFKSKMENSGYTMEPVQDENAVDFLTIKSDMEYEDDDILVCKGWFYFTGGLKIVDTVIYSVYRNNVRRPEGKGILRSIELQVMKISGKINK